MIKDYVLEHEMLRRHVWMNAWVAVANATNSYEASTATRWADIALRDFDERFSVPVSKEVSA